MAVLRKNHFRVSLRRSFCRERRTAAQHNCPAACSAPVHRKSSAAARAQSQTAAHEIELICIIAVSLRCDRLFTQRSAANHSSASTASEQAIRPLSNENHRVSRLPSSGLNKAVILFNQQFGGKWLLSSSHVFTKDTSVCR